MAAEYHIFYRSPTGILLGEIPFSKLQYSRQENEIGALVLTPAYQYESDYFKRDGTFEVWRSVNGGDPYLDGETNWFIRKVRHYTEDSGLDGIEITAFDATSVLDRRIIAYNSGNSYTVKLDTADNIIKDLVWENLGASCFDPLRDMSAYITVEPGIGLAPIVYKDCSWANLFQTMQEVAKASEEQGVRVIFDLVFVKVNQYIFRTWITQRGANHGSTGTNQVLVSRENNNLSAPELLMDYSTEVNYCYAGGRGEGAGREWTYAADNTRILASPFNRMEGFVDARNAQSEEAVLQEGMYGLFAGRPNILFFGTIVQTPNTIYGIHYRFGDIVTAQYKGISFDCRVGAILVTVDNNGEKIETKLTGGAFL